MGLVFLVGFVAIVLRLFYWQVIRGPELSVRAEGQYFDVLTLSARRGDILERNNMKLAGSVPTFLLYAYKPQIDADRQSLARRLVEVLGWTSEFSTVDSKDDQSLQTAHEREEELDRKLGRDSLWESLAERITVEQKKIIEQWGIRGLGFQPTSSRSYPDASMSAHVLGFVGKDAIGKPKGYFGLEGYYDKELRGVDGSLRQEKDAIGKPILVGTFQEIPPRAGRTLTTTIDRYVQFIAEGELLNGLQKYGASAGEVVVMDPKTGVILASASYPNFDPGAFWKFNSSLFRNPTISESYEPGSTFKVLVMSAAIDSGAVKPDTSCDSCDGPVQMGKYTMRTWNDQYRPGLSMKDVIVHSDNTGMIFVSHKLGKERMLEYIKKFGFGELTGIDLQGEVSPELRTSWSEIDLATASFGQGIATTTIQMIRAVGAIANGGVLMTPHFVSSIIDKEEIPIKPKPVRRVISQETARTMTDMMVSAVQDGEAKFAAPRGYQVAGKTGTAQIPLAGHYDQDKTIVSFVGFAPADDPKFVMLVKLTEPTSSPWGAETAAPLWFSIAKRLFVYWEIPPNVP